MRVFIITVIMMVFSIAEVMAQGPRGRMENSGGSSFGGMIMFFVVGFIVMIVIGQIKNKEEAKAKIQAEAKDKMDKHIKYSKYVCKMFVNNKGNFTRKQFDDAMIVAYGNDRAKELTIDLTNRGIIDIAM